MEKNTHYQSTLKEMQYTVLPSESRRNDRDTEVSFDFVIFHILSITIPHSLRHDSILVRLLSRITLSSEYSEIKIWTMCEYTLPMSEAPDAYHNGRGLKVIQSGEKVNYEVKFELLR